MKIKTFSNYIKEYNEYDEEEDELDDMKSDKKEISYNGNIYDINLEPITKEVVEKSLMECFNNVDHDLDFNESDVKEDIDNFVKIKMTIFWDYINNMWEYSEDEIMNIIDRNYE